MKTLKVKCIKTRERGKERCRRFSWTTKQFWKQDSHKEAKIWAHCEHSQLRWNLAPCTDTSGHCWAHQPFRSCRVGEKTFSDSQTKAFCFNIEMVDLGGEEPEILLTGGASLCAGVVLPPSIPHPLQFLSLWLADPSTATKEPLVELPTSGGAHPLEPCLEPQCGSGTSLLGRVRWQQHQNQQQQQEHC